MIKFFKENYKQIILSIVVSIILGAIFIGYMIFIGIPKTQARNYYNIAQYHLERGNKEKAKENLEKALEYWEEDYIRKELESID